MRVVAVAGLAGVLLVAVVGVSRGVTRAPAADLLPDLVHQLPYSLTVTRSGGAYRLGFASSVTNEGAGPLVVDARRARRTQPTMSANQLIKRDTGGWRQTSEVGRLRYVLSETHQHWHLLPFDRYELRAADPASGVRLARKTGFCLGDRYRAEVVPPLEGPPSAVYRGECGKGDRRRLSLRQGISVGYGDVYRPNLEGQSFVLTGLPEGEYVLSQHVNGERRLRETDYANNAASIRLRLTWPLGEEGKPGVETIARCPGTLDCPAP
jgi:hypothetical protein